MSGMISRDLFVARAEHAEWTKVDPSFLKNLPAKLGVAYGVRVYRVGQDEGLYVVWQHSMNHSDVLAYRTTFEYWDEVKAALSTAPQMTREGYVKNHGTTCPFCGSDDLEGGSVEIDNGGAYQGVRCLCCDEDWTDTYALTGYEV